MNNATERRRFSRIAFRAAVTLSQEEKTWTCQLLDLSLKGLLMEKPSDCVLSEEAPINVNLGLDDGSNIAMEVVLERSDQDSMGFSCKAIDLESLGHLQRLIELNSGDPDMADRSISELLLQPE